MFDKNVDNDNLLWQLNSVALIKSNSMAQMDQVF